MKNLLNGFLRRFGLGVFGSVLVSAVSAFATPSTHIWAPSTDIQAYKVFHLTSDIYVPAGPNQAGVFIAPVINTGLTVGFLPFSKFQGEVGFDHIAGFGAADLYPLYLNIKVGSPEGSFGSYFPALVAGAYSIGTKTDVTDYNIIYGKTAKTFGKAGKFSLGYYSGNDKLLLDDKGNKDASGVLACWEKTVSEISDKLWVAVEYQGGKSALGTINFGVAWAFSDKVGLILGYDIYNNPTLPPTYTVQTDVNF